MFQVIGPQPCLAFHVESAGNGVLGIGLFGIDVSRKPQSGLHVDPPAIEVEEGIQAGARFVSSIEANDVVVLVLDPDAAQEVRAFDVFFRDHVEDQRAYVSEELLAKILQLIVIFIELVIEKDKLHEPERNIVHPVKAIQAIEHAAHESRAITALKSLFADASLVQNQPAKKILVALGNAAQLLVRFHVLDIGLYQGSILVHVLDQLGFGIEDAVSHGIVGGRCLVVIFIFFRFFLVGCHQRHAQGHYHKQRQQLVERTHNSSRHPGLFSQLKNNVDRGDGIVRASIALCRGETDLLGSAFRGLIQAVSQAAHDPLNLYVPGSPEHDFEKHFALYTKLARLFGVDRLRFELNFYRRLFRFCFSPRTGPIATAAGGSYFAKPALRDCPFAAVIAVANTGDAIAKSGACNRAALAASAARPISVTCT